MKVYIFTGHYTVHGWRYLNGSNYVVVASYELDAWNEFRKKYPEAKRTGWVIGRIDTKDKQVISL